MSDQSNEVDWKEIALQLAKRVNFAVCNLKAPPGSSVLLNTNSKVGDAGAFIGWREYMAQALEMVPGITIDREMMDTLNLPAAKRRKAQAAIKKARGQQ